MQRQIRQKPSVLEQWFSWQILQQKNSTLSEGSYQVFLISPIITLVSFPPKNAVLRISGNLGCQSWEIRCSPGQRILMGRKHSTVGISSYSETDYVELSFQNNGDWLVTGHVGNLNLMEVLL